MKHTAAFLCLGTPGNTSALFLWDHFKQQNRQQKARKLQKKKKKKTLVYSKRTEARSLSITLCDPSGKPVLRMTPSFCSSVHGTNDYKNAVSIDLGVTNFRE